jgi:hypothetical protein
MPVQADDVQAPADSSNGKTDRLTTFHPLRPDLHAPMHFLVPQEEPRDLLAPPIAKSTTPSRELPKLLQGTAGVTASVAEDGRIRFDDPKAVSVELGELGLQGKFDLTDRVMKATGQDPYAAVKYAIAEKTREQRVCMAKRYQGERQKQELFALAGKVRRIAAQVDLSLVQRRNLIFDIWDECLEESDSAIDYGTLARATILSVIREAFPAGTDRAYPSTEILALNQRRSSRQQFAPYDTSPIKRIRHPDAGAPTECP